MLLCGTLTDIIWLRIVDEVVEASLEQVLSRSRLL